MHPDPDEDLEDVIARQNREAALAAAEKAPEPEEPVKPKAKPAAKHK